MNQTYDKLWLTLDTIERKLLSAKRWSTSSDDYDQNIKEALNQVKEAKQKLETILIQAEQAAQAQVSARWEADLKHGSWLSKNIRPITLVFLTAVFVILSVFDGNLGEFTIGESYVPVYQTLLITVYGAYFAGRSIEKVRKVTK